MGILNKAWKYLPYTGVEAVSKKNVTSDSDSTSEINTKYHLFDDPSITKNQRIQRLSIVNKFDDKISPYSNQTGMVRNDFYAQYINKTQGTNKPSRIEEYRSMALTPEVEACLNQIKNEFFSENEHGEIFDLKISDVSEEIQTIIKDEFNRFIEIFKLDEVGDDLIMDLLIESELFFENIVSIEKPHLGIIGAKRIGADRIDPIYVDVDNDVIDLYVLRKMVDEKGISDARAYSTFPTSNGQNGPAQNILFNGAQITYLRSGKWDTKKSMMLSVLECAKRAYKQLTLTEDATVIYMLVRAPERLAFNIFTGNLQGPQAEEYLMRQISQFWTNKRMNAEGGVENAYDPQSMIENYYFAKPAGGEGSTVDSIGGGSQTADNLDILNYFVQKVYEAMKIPSQRLNAGDKFSDGTEITREELTFARYVITLQKKFVRGIKQAFITHLKLKGKKLKDLCKTLDISYDDMMGNAFDFNKFIEIEEAVDGSIPARLNSLKMQKEDVVSNIMAAKTQQSLLMENSGGIDADIDADIAAVMQSYNQELSTLNKDIYKIESSESWWNQYDLSEDNIKIKLNEPSQFFTLRKQQELQIKLDNYQKYAADDMMSNTYAMKSQLGMTDKEISVNRTYLRKDAAFIWEITQIQQNGPDFRKAAEEAAAGMGGADLGGGAGLLDGMEGGADLGGDAEIDAEDTDLPEFGNMPDDSGE